MIQTTDEEAKVTMERLQVNRCGDFDNGLRCERVPYLGLENNGILGGANIYMDGDVVGLCDEPGDGITRQQ